MNLIGSVENKNVLIRDDMIDTAGSIAAAAECVKQNGALDIYAAATHGVLSGQALETIEKSPIKKLIISDSIDQSKRAMPDKIEVLTCSELIGEAIKRIADEESVSSLFEDQPMVV